LAIWNADDGSTLDLGADLRRAVVSPDRSQIAALGESGAAFLVNPATGERTALDLPDAPDQLAWGGDGRTLYYSTLTPGEPFVVSDPALQNRAERLLKVFPYESALNPVSIAAIDLTTGVATPWWQGQAYAVGQMAVAPNNAGMVFSLIPSDREYILAFSQNAEYADLRFLLPETQLYWLPPGGGEPRLIAVSSQPAFASAIPPGQ
jgi:hypothetical protein